MDWQIHHGALTWDSHGILWKSEEIYGIPKHNNGNPNPKLMRRGVDVNILLYFSDCPLPPISDTSAIPPPLMEWTESSHSYVRSRHGLYCNSFIESGTDVEPFRVNISTEMRHHWVTMMWYCGTKPGSRIVTLDKCSGRCKLVQSQIYRKWFSSSIPPHPVYRNWNDIMPNPSSISTELYTLPERYSDVMLCHVLFTLYLKQF